jgi:hypothetical protein
VSVVRRVFWRVCALFLSLSAAASASVAGTQDTWRGDLWATWNSLNGDAYALDGVGRFLPEGRPPRCDAQGLVRYAGTSLRYRGAVYVAPAFRERLARFELVAADVAREIYGRAPTRLRHAGAFSCRATRQRSQRLSEHALGNAIDVIGFDFARAPAPRRGATLPKALRRPFEVRVERHWKPAAADASTNLHMAFLRALAERLAERDDVFRVMIGPSHRDHVDHFHFDMSPWHYVNF